MALSKPSTPVQKLVAWEMKNMAAPINPNPYTALDEVECRCIVSFIVSVLSELKVGVDPVKYSDKCHGKR